jgi:hypothetical protein
MFMTELLQRIIHVLEVGTGSRMVRTLMVGMIVLTLGLCYDLREFRNFSTPEAMESAQLARNIAEGRGYVTDFVRPLSLFLVSQWNEAKDMNKAVGPDPDFGRIRQGHPDLENPPVYPLFLAGWMKVLPFHYVVEFKKAFWSEQGQFARYEPDFLIMLINQLLLLVLARQTFLLARKLFDEEVAWVSVTLVLGGEIFWEFSRAGLSTLLVMVIFMGLTQLLLHIEARAREKTSTVNELLALAVAAGVLTGVGALTRYSFGAVIVPVAVFLILFGEKERWRQGLFASAAFLVVLGSWVLRNYHTSGTPFGTAGFALVEGSGYDLQRSLHPDFAGSLRVLHMAGKLLPNLISILQNNAPQLGRSWVTMCFFAGLLMGFRSLPIRRLRYFLLMCLGTLAVAQALGRTQLSDESPVINTENLLVLVLPLILIYGAAFFFTCLDQFELPSQTQFQSLRYGAMAAFTAIMCLPLLGALCSGGTIPVAYPPYYPPDILRASGWMKKNELTMSDVPWAVAWYGHRQCVWLTLDTDDNYFAINDNFKPVQALYLTPESMDKKLYSECLYAPQASWNQFVLKTLGQGIFPARFPLRDSPSGPYAVSSGLYLTDRARWLETFQPAVTPPPDASGP